MGIAYHKALKARAKLPKQPVHLPPATPAWSQTNDPAKLLQHQDLQYELARALEHLSPEQRTVVELVVYQAYSYQEIATIMGCPVNTVKTRMFYARRRLRTILARAATPKNAGDASRPQLTRFAALATASVSESE